jgi:hypothetical protein
MLNDDGDIIKACGFLAIYSGNLEDELDELYGIAKSFCPQLSDYEHLRFADKARHMRKALLRKFKEAPTYPQKSGEEPRVRAILNHCKVIANARNEIFHSSIYSEPDGRTMMKNKRRGTRPIASGPVYKLANEVWDMHGAVYGLRFAVTRLKLAMEKRGTGPESRRKRPAARGG